MLWISGRASCHQLVARIVADRRSMVSLSVDHTRRVSSASFLKLIPLHLETNKTFGVTFKDCEKGVFKNFRM
jgi:hypothetical protein